MPLCPNCEQEINCDQRICPHCYRPINSYFSFRSFLKENFQLFAIIGVIGGMIALLPNLAQQILGNNWQCSDSVLPMFLAILLIFGSFFIMFIFIFIIHHLWSSCRNYETRIHIIRNFYVRVGDFSRLIVSCCLIFMAIGFVYFIGISSLLISNIYARVASIVILSILIVVILSSLPYIIFSLIYGIKEAVMRQTIFGFIALIALILLMILSSINPLSLPSVITIVPDQQYYLASESNFDGITLTATNVSLYQSHWVTNYGYFISSNQVCSQVNYGDGVFITGSKIIWRYPYNDIGKNKPPVQINLELFDNNFDPIFVNSTLNLTWYKTDFAHVNESP